MTLRGFSDYGRTGRIITRDYCSACDATGRTPGGDGRCPACDNDLVYKTFADYLTVAERVERAFPIPMTNDNEGRTRHYSTASKRRLAIEKELHMFGFYRRHAPKFKQRVTLTRLLGHRQAFWDWDSVLRGNAKEIIDALAALRFFVSDSPRYVLGVAGEQSDEHRAYGGGVRILIERAE